MKKEKVGKGKWERGGKPSSKASRERIQVACYLFGEAYENVKIKEKRRNMRAQNDRERKIQRNEMKKEVFCANGYGKRNESEERISKQT